MKKIGLLLLVGLVIAASCSTLSLSAAGKTLRLAEVHSKGYPTEVADEKFAELVEKKTNGKLKIQVYPDSQLGSESNAIEQVKLGVIEFARVSLSPVGAVEPAVNVFNLPYLFNSQAHMWKVLNSSIGAYFLKVVEKNDLIGLTYFESGARNFYTKKLVKTPADLKGLKIRVQPSPINNKLMEAFGATGVAIDFGEVYSALQTGVADAAENNIPSWVSKSHYEVAKYMIFDGHSRIPEILMVSKKFFTALTPAEQKAVREAAKEATAFQIKKWNEAEDDYLATAKAKGCTITQANVAEFQAAASKAYTAIYAMPEYKGLKTWVDKIKAVK
ncbi:MAG TPA: TRAP transporter substrate-binding protein [Bacillota bacterium]|nr:TRAP transporter substrate-binding protein [Bacillota bacterium]